MTKFCANLSFLFTEEAFLQRYKLAKEAGFTAVETGFPYGMSKHEVVYAKNAANIQQILINIYTGDVTKGELGFAAIPGKENEFKDSLAKTIEYAKALDVKKIHIMSGAVIGHVGPAHDATFVNNLKYAAKVLEHERIMGLIEPINKYSVPWYYMNSFDKAIAVINKVNSPNLKLMLDIFHVQMIKGNITNTIVELKDYTGHVQIAQVPYRNEPNTRGELNYGCILEVLREKGGYKDWIGLEYIPLADTKEGLKWIQQYGYDL